MSWPRFIHSFWPFLYRLFKSTTTQRHSRLQHGFCIGVSRRSAWAIVGKELAQGPYVADTAGVEPITLRLRVIDLTNAPPRPTTMTHISDKMRRLSRGMATKNRKSLILHIHGYLCHLTSLTFSL